MKKMNSSQLRVFVRSQLVEADSARTAQRLDSDKYYFTEVQEAINVCMASLTELSDNLVYLQSLASEYGDPEFEFDANEATAMLLPMWDLLEDYAHGADATGQVTAGAYD